MFKAIYLVLLLIIVTSEIYGVEGASVTVVQKKNGKKIFAPSSNTEKEKDLKCGELLEVSNKVSILTHRFNTPLVSQDEQCIWTLNAGNRSHIKINVTDNNFYYSAKYQYLEVGYFNNSNYDQFNSFTWIKLPNVQTPYAIEVPGPVVFIHFSSYLANLSPEPSFGFQLTFQAGGEEQTSIYNYENYVFVGKYGKFKYPPNGGSYKNNQRVTIVVKADSGLPVEGHPSPSKLHIINKGIGDSQDCSVDNLNLYIFSGSKWGKTESFCGPADNTIHRYLFMNPRNPPMVLTFKSEDIGGGSGFEIHWLNDDI